MYEQLDIFSYLLDLEKKNKKTRKRNPSSCVRNRSKETSIPIKKLISLKKSVLRDFGLSNQVINDAFDDKEIVSASQIDIIGNELLHKYFMVLDVKDAARSMHA